MSQAEQRSWWGRNWKWVVPVGCLTPLLACGGGITLLVVFVFNTLKASEPYQTALARAQADPRVQAALGEPVQAGFLVGGNISTHTTIVNGVQNVEEEEQLTIPISGPKGSGTLEAAGKKSGGKWTVTTLKVKIAGQAEPIDLLADK